MSEDYFEFAHICGDKMILHGWRADQSRVERELSEDERKRVEHLVWRQEAALTKLLRELAGEA